MESKQCLERKPVITSQGRMREGTHGGGGGALLILHLLAFPFHRQSTFNIALHCTHIKKIKKRNKMYSD